MELLVALLFLSLLFSSSAEEELTNLSDIQLQDSPATGLCAHLIEPSGYLCSEHIAQTKDGYLLGLQRVSSSGTGDLKRQTGPPVLLLHGLMMVMPGSWIRLINHWVLSWLIMAFDVWAGNVRGTRWSHGHVYLTEKEKEFWDWSWQELALYDLAEMARYIRNITNSKVFLIGHSQGTIMSLAALTQPDIASMVEAAALLCPVSYLGHISAPFVLRLVKMHIDEVLLAMGIGELNFKSSCEY